MPGREQNISFIRNYAIIPTPFLAAATQVDLPAGRFLVCLGVQGFGASGLGSTLGSAARGRGGGTLSSAALRGPTHPTPAIAPDVGDSESKGNAINPKW